MDSLATNLLPVSGWVLRATWHASLLIVLVLAVQKVFGRRLGVRGRYWLWFVVLVRMVMPWGIPSRASVHNLLPRAPAVSAIMATAGLDSATTRETSAAGGSGSAEAAGSPVVEDSSVAREGLWTPPEEQRPAGRIAAFLSMAWLAGACALSGCILASYIRLHRILRRGRPVGDRWILDLLEDCRRMIGTRARVGVVAADGIGSPALWGLFRPRLVLPGDTLARGDRTELRHIFLHELAHLKRHDILIGHVASALHVLHWFNPLIALGVRRMRADREMACDGMVLSVLGRDEAPAYGRTIVLQVERLLASRPPRALAGLSGDGILIKQRIAMIAQPRRQTYRWSILAVVVFDLLAFAGLTDAIVVHKPPAYLPAQAWPTTHQDKHESIVRIYIHNRDIGQYLAVEEGTVVCVPEVSREAGLWEARFDDGFGGPSDVVYLYYVATGTYLTSDEQGNLAAHAVEPVDAARWTVVARPGGNWVISCDFQNGYLRLDEQGTVSAVEFGRDVRGCWDIDQLWRVKTSDNPKSDPQWRRENIPGPDWYGTRPGWPAPE